MCPQQNPPEPFICVRGAEKQRFAPPIWGDHSQETARARRKGVMASPSRIRGSSARKCNQNLLRRIRHGYTTEN